MRVCILLIIDNLNYNLPLYSYHVITAVLQISYPAIIETTFDIARLVGHTECTPLDASTVVGGATRDLAPGRLKPLVPPMP
jgi:hypothetical protein